MRAFSVGLLVFAMVVFVVSAFPEGKEKDNSQKLKNLENGNGAVKPLQRRKPPGKVPGPKLTSDELHPTTEHEDEHPSQHPIGHPDHDKQKHPSLTREEKKKRLAPLDDKGNDKKHKDKHLDEESQEEKTTAL